MKFEFWGCEFDAAGGNCSEALMTSEQVERYANFCNKMKQEDPEYFNDWKKEGDIWYEYYQGELYESHCCIDGLYRIPLYDAVEIATR